MSRRHLLASAAACCAPAAVQSTTAVSEPALHRLLFLRKRTQLLRRTQRLGELSQTANDSVCPLAARPADVGAICCCVAAASAAGCPTELRNLRTAAYPPQASACHSIIYIHP
jgi:hypothetical protein